MCLLSSELVTPDFKWASYYDIVGIPQTCLSFPQKMRNLSTQINAYLHRLRKSGNSRRNTSLKLYQMVFVQLAVHVHRLFEEVLTSRFGGIMRQQSIASGEIELEFE